MTKRLLPGGFLAAAAIFAVSGCAQTTVTSPGGVVQATVSVDNAGQLAYRVQRGGAVVVEDSRLGVTVDGVKLGDGVTVGAPKMTAVNEEYPWRGVHAKAVNHCNVMALPVAHKASGTEYTLEVRAYDDGVAYRYVIPGQGSRTVSGEASSWTLPAGSRVWYHTNTKNYEGIHLSRLAETFKPATHIAPPMVAQLPGKGGYVAITESALYDYSGMTLLALGERVFQADFEDDKSWTLSGTITTPWRIAMLSGDLNGLVNSDIIHNCSPPPPAALAGAKWIRPGRALWSWWSEGTGNWPLHKAYADAAAKLGFEYILIDEGWEGWKDGSKDKWALVKEVVDHAKTRNVDVWVWKRWNQVADANVRDDFFKNVKAAGVVGVKVDFMDSESKERIDFYTACLRDAARHRLMINFHGANKPTGEARTWPNEMTREGVRGLEYNKWLSLPAKHNATLPLTRFLAGHGDYTPGTFDPKKMKGTSWAHQLATTIVFTSPVVHWADNPKNYLSNPAVDVIKTIPPVWDETLVLGASELGKIAAFARRTGTTWFIGVLNGGGELVVKIPLTFLGDGKYQAVLLADDAAQPDAFARSEKAVTSSETLTVQMRKGGGFVARFTKTR
ncbi:MAG: glycoside hydrolase family 97 catalytic domain-containing protein [Phycisphaerae bacterium]|nr:glycoside hydrolase family 97 catalytic domain-containing protein [Phycisphaerae bacterium]